VSALQGAGINAVRTFVSGENYPSPTVHVSLQAGMYNTDDVYENGFAYTYKKAQCEIELRIWIAVNQDVTDAGTLFNEYDGIIEKLQVLLDGHEIPDQVLSSFIVSKIRSAITFHTPEFDDAATQGFGVAGLTIRYLQETIEL
jgi:hypothetical protein